MKMYKKKTKTKTNTIHTHKLKQQQQKKNEQLSLMNHFTPKITLVFILTVWLHNSYKYASLDNLVLDCLIIP